MTPVYTVFDGAEMQQMVLFLTQQAETTIYQQVKQVVHEELSFADFLALIKQDAALKRLVQDLILSALANAPLAELLPSALFR